MSGVAPRWCDNRLVIVKQPGRPFNPAAALRELHPDPKLPAAGAAGQVLDALTPLPVSPEVLSFERLLPTPDSALASDRWEQWRLDYWGTQLDARDSRVVDEFPHMVSLIFRTAWFPPVSWFEELARQHPHWNVELSYREEGTTNTGTLRAFPWL